MNCFGRMLVVILTSVLMPLLSPAQQAMSGAQDSVPLGDVARKARSKSKTPAKVLTNDDLAGTGADYHNGAATTAASDTAAEGSSPVAKTDSSAGGADRTSDQTAKGAEATKQQDDNFRSRYLQLKDKLTLLEREVKVSQREYEIKVAEFYADAGLQARDPKGWTEQQQKLQEEKAGKQKQLDKVKEEMEALKDEGRKAGVSPRAFED